MKTPEEKVQKIIDDADQAFDKHDCSTYNKLYLKENARCEFLKVHLKVALETIEYMKAMEESNNEFYTMALKIKLK